MKTFKDSADRVWSISIHVTAIKKVKGLLNIDLYKLIDNKLEGLGNLLSDPIQLVDVIYVLCKEEADKAGVSDEDFGCSLWGEGIERATEAFLQEFVDFFPDPRVREGIKKVLNLSHKLRDQIVEKGMREMDELDLEKIAKEALKSNELDLEKVVKEALKSNGSSGNSQDQSELTQGLLPFVS